MLLLLLWVIDVLFRFACFASRSEGVFVGGSYGRFMSLAKDLAYVALEARMECRVADCWVL